MDATPQGRPDSDDETVSAKRPRATAIKWFVGIGILVVGAILIASTVRALLEGRRSAMCQSNLGRIGLALHYYHDRHKAFPPSYISDENGKPLHSWRTLLLPYMGENELYESIDLTKPWDDPANEKARNTQVPAYQCPSLSDRSLTTYLAIVTPDSCLQPNERRPFSDIKDGPSKTWWLVEVAQDDAVHWMAPEDADEQTVLSIRPDSKLSHSGIFSVACVDGTARHMNADTSDADRRTMISIAGDDRASEGME